jgi:asparagine synthase (glutamine-hydrolysing)
LHARVRAQSFESRSSPPIRPESNLCAGFAERSTSAFNDATFVEYMADAGASWSRCQTYVDACITRFRIVDHRPSCSATTDGGRRRVQLVFNGEIYNYRELRRDLIARGRVRPSDSEVLLASYLEWGRECVRAARDVGVCDLTGELSALLLSRPIRHQFSSLPLRWESTVFAVSLRHRAAGIATPRSRGGARLSRVRAVDQTSRTSSRASLPGAHSLVFDHHGLSVTRYWDVPRDGHRPAEPVEAVRDAFLESISLHLRSDVPVGT